MAVNPHAETYQGKTQFSGPVKAGTRWEDWPTYSRLDFTQSVTDFPNTGYVVCSQSCAVQQFTSLTVTDITLPPGTMIISIQFIVTTAYTGTDKDLYVFVDPGGTDSTGEGLTPSPYTVVDAVGVYNVGPQDNTGANVSVWRNLSDPTYVTGAEPGISLDVRTASSNTGDGRAILTINYIPEFNYPLA